MKKCTGSISGDHEHCEDLPDSRGDMVTVCHDCEQVLGKICEVYSRVVGYIRPVSGWNKGKQAEFKARTMFTMRHPPQSI